jgi:hypothetical protein
VNSELKFNIKGKLLQKIFYKIIFLLTKFFFRLKIMRSFSQEGEDLIIERILNFNKIKSKDIFYLDIGAGHPIRYSNTLFFYHKDAKGITVDANYKNIFLHKFLRPKDLSFNFLLGNSNEVVEYYKFKQTELNTTSQSKVNELAKKNIFPIDKEKIIQKKFSDFCNNELKDKLSKINFFNIDIEGGELELIKLIDWTNFNPNIICIEIASNNFNEIFESEIYKIILSQKYKLFSKLYNSVIFIKNLK